MRSMSIFSCIIWTFAGFSIAQSSENNWFINPVESTDTKEFGQNAAWQWGSFQFLQWRSVWENLNLKVYQNDNPAFWIVTPDDVHGSGVQGLGYNSTFPLIQLDYTLPFVFFFRMNNVDNDSQTFSSQYFNLTGVPPPPVPSSFVSSSSIIASPSHTPSPTVAAVPSPSPRAASPTPTRQAVVSSERASHTAHPAASATQDTQEQSTIEPTDPSTATEEPSGDGLSSSVAAGIGVGAGLSALILAVLIIGMLYYRRKANKAKAARQRAKDASDDHAAAWEAKADRSTYSATHRPRYYEQQRPPVELPYNEPRGGYYNPQELP